MPSRNIRINIILDETLVKACQKITGIKTRRELVDYALRELLLYLEGKFVETTIR